MNQVVLEIGGSKIDVSDLNISITYVVADITNPGKRNKGYSYTIKIVGSNEVNQIFASLYDLQQEVDAENFPYNNFAPTHFTPFNANKKIPSRLFVDGLNIFEGYLELKDIVINPDGTIIYSINLKNEGVKWLIDAEATNLQDLDLGSDCFDIDLFNGAQPDTFDTKGNLYCMPLNEYGSLFADLANTNNIDLENIYPAFFVREVLIQAFNSIGYELQFPLLDSTPYERLTMPFFNETWETTAGFLGSALYDVENNTPTFVNYDPPLAAVTAVAISFDTVLFDLANYAQNQVLGTNLFTLNNIHHCNSGHFNISGQYSLTFDCFTITGAQTITLEIYKNAGATLIHQDQQTITLSAANQTFVYFFDFNEYIAIGDFISFKILFDETLSSPGADITNVNENYFFATVKLHEWKKEGAKFNWSGLLPNITLLDLVKELTTLFNLYYVNPRDSRTIKFLTYDEYYTRPELQTTGRVNDWGCKLDESKGLVLEHSIKVYGNYISFAYDEGDDFFNTEFQETNNITYTKKTLQTGYELVSKGQEIVVESVPTFTYSPVGDAAYYNFLNVAYFAEEEEIDLPVQDNTDIGLRFLLYTLQTTTEDILIAYDDFTNVNTYNQYGGLYFETHIHWDNDVNGLYVRFYQRQSNRIIRGRFIEAFLHLTLSDIHNLDFSKLIKIGNQYYILNKVEQFTPNNESISKVELLQIK